MIRILQMIGSLNAGGSQTMIMNIYRNIDRTKMQFDFVLDHPNETYFAEEVKAMGGRIFTMPAFNGANAAEIKRDWNNFFYLHPEYKVLHCHVPGYASLYLPLAKKHGVKSIVHCHTVSRSSGALAMAKNALLYPLKNQADILMASSAEAGLWLYGEKAMKSDRYIMMPRPVDTAALAFSESARTSCRKKLGLEGRFVLGHVGPFYAAQRQDFVIEAFAKLREQKSDASLLLVGEGPLQLDAAKKAMELGVAEHVILCPESMAMGELLSAMDILACPAKVTGLPHILLQAQANSLPCLISEEISREADISPLVRRLPADNAQLWADEMLKPCPRQDATDALIKAGYDTISVALQLGQLYRKLNKEAGK